MTKPFFYTAFLLALAAAGFWALVRYLEAVAVFFPSRSMGIKPADVGLTCEDLYFKTMDQVTLNAWFFKNPRARSTLIFAHGNAGNMSDRLFKIRFFHDLGLNVLIFDYRGYGKSEGRPTENGVYLDAQAAYDHLKARGDVDMDKIILYGASIGGVVMVDLACRRPAALLVVESSITSARDMAKILYPFIPSFVLSLKFDSLAKVKTLKTPKLFIHSPDDEVVPYWVGEKLFQAAAEPKAFLKIHGGHNDGSITVDAAAAAAFSRLLKEQGLL